MNFILGTNENTPELKDIQTSLHIEEKFDTVDDPFRFVENKIDPFQYQRDYWVFIGRRQL